MNHLWKFLFFLLICMGLTGCGDIAEESPAAVQKVNEKAGKAPGGEIHQEELLASLRSYTNLEPLGDIPIPEDNPMSPEVLELGKALFFDPRLSGNNQVSCSTCHEPELGYGDGKPTFDKYGGGQGERNSPTVINSGYYQTNFWDGRAESLEEQALGPIENPNEMNQPLAELIEELATVQGYQERFQAAFPDGLTAENIAKALAAFQRQIVVKDTPFDRFMQGEMDALTPQEVRGLDLFAGKAMCITCHNGPNLSDNQYYNIGLNTEDQGRFAVTGEETDMGRIRTPSLYGITHTAPYMSNGSIDSLAEVIDYYDRGGDNHPNKSFFMKQFMSPIGLTDEEKADLLAFLKTLGGNPPVFTKPELP